MEKNKLSGIPETLLIALWARAAATQECEAIINDQKAVEMISHIDYDFSRFEKSSNLTRVGVAVRTLLLDNALAEFLNRHSNAVVINLGAGLDTRHSRMNCRNVDWYEIDVPESIDLRRKFFSESSNYHFIAQTMFDLSWVEKINILNRPVIFLAEGLFMYFSEQDLRPFFCELIRKFPGAEMVFEMLAPLMVGRSRQHETLKRIDSQAEFRWGLKNSRDMEKWSHSIRFIGEWNYYDFYKKRWGLWGFLGRLPVIGAYLSCRIVHLKFACEASH